MKTNKIAKKHRRTARKAPQPTQATAPFIEHLHELRKRAYAIALSVLATGTAIYFVQQKVVNLLLRPAHGQHFIYTSPGGGIDFLFRICIYGGLVASTPVIVYNILGFLEPLVTAASRRFLAIGATISGVLAIIGVVFGYIVGLPSALHFLLHQFHTVQIQPLVTIQSYLGFVIAYMLGSALLFQMPLILVFINRVKPLKPKKLFHYERWVILAAFVLAGLMNPTPNILSQLLIAGPFIIVYQFGILLIAIINRPRYSSSVQKLVAQDNLQQAQRVQPRQALLPPELLANSTLLQTAAVVPVVVPRQQRPVRYIDNMVIASPPKPQPSLFTPGPVPRPQRPAFQPMSRRPIEPMVVHERPHRYIDLGGRETRGFSADSSIA